MSSEANPVGPWACNVVSSQTFLSILACAHTHIHMPVASHQINPPNRDASQQPLPWRSTRLSLSVMKVWKEGEISQETGNLSSSLDSVHEV